MNYLVETFTGPGALFSWAIMGITLYGMVRSVLVKTGAMQCTSRSPVIFSLLTGLLGFIVGLVLIMDALPRVPIPHRGQALWTGISVDLAVLAYAAMGATLLYALYLLDMKTINRKNEGGPV